MSTTPIRRALLPVGATLLAVTLAACGSDTGHSGDHGSMTGGSTASSSPSAASDHDQADVMFSAMMIPHHEQAVEMADLVPSRTENPQVRALADKIRAEQQPEIETMKGWLEEWGATPMDMAGDHSGHGMSGMMSDEDMTALAGLEGAAFDRRWLEMMVAHHEGAIEMAQSVIASGKHEGTRTLAQAIITAQKQEIEEMRTLLG